MTYNLNTKDYVQEAINLKTYPLNDNDKILLAYSKDKGLIRLVAKGVKKTKSKLASYVESLVANKLFCKSGRSLDIISSASSLDTFKNIRNDIVKLMFSMYLAEVVINFGVEKDPNSFQIYDLFFKALKQIANTTSKLEFLLVTLRFQLKMMEISGFDLDFYFCVDCGKPIEDMNNVFYSYNQHGMICYKCKLSNLSKTMVINKKIVDFLSVLKKSDFNEKTYYDKMANEKICKSCFLFLYKYIEYYSDKKFKTIQTLEEIL